MSTQTVTTTSGSPSYAFLLFLVFLVLKLTGVVAWSWWWITAPLWIGFAFIGVLALVSFGVAFLVIRSRR